jgi:hypothetical protein
MVYSYTVASNRHRTYKKCVNTRWRSLLAELQIDKSFRATFVRIYLWLYLQYYLPEIGWMSVTVEARYIVDELERSCK